MFLWIVLIAAVILLTFLNQKQLYSSKVKRAYSDIRMLAKRVQQGDSSPHELSLWETSLAELEKHPNEYNKLDMELGLRRQFVMYLERHYPSDPRLPELQEAAAYQKDSVWGIKLGDYGAKKK